MCFRIFATVATSTARTTLRTGYYALANSSSALRKILSRHINYSTRPELLPRPETETRRWRNGTTWKDALQHQTDLERTYTHTYIHTHTHTGNRLGVSMSAGSCVWRNGSGENVGDFATRSLCLYGLRWEIVIIDWRVRYLNGRRIYMRVVYVPVMVARKHWISWY